MGRVGSTPTPGTRKGQAAGLGRSCRWAPGHRMVTSRAELDTGPNARSSRYQVGYSSSSVVVEALDRMAVYVEGEGDGHTLRQPRPSRRPDSASEAIERRQVGVSRVRHWPTRRARFAEVRGFIEVVIGSETVPLREGARLGIRFQPHVGRPRWPRRDSCGASPRQLP
jgi:hypothetical protein